MTNVSVSQETHDHDHDYSELLSSVRQCFASVTALGGELFLTTANDRHPNLFQIYLDTLPAERQLHNCHACRRFMEQYGSLVAIGKNGELISAMWDAKRAPDFYRPVFAALQRCVESSRILSPFLSTKPVWGTPVTGKWSHIAAEPPRELLHRERALTAEQKMAAMRENFNTVSRALNEFTTPMLDQALRLFEGEALARSDKFIGPVKWLRDLQDRPKGRPGHNLLWQAVADAPEGYCHPRASVVGSLLEDIAAGKPFAEIKRSFDAKLGGLIYQRPQVAPSAGNIKQAEELFAKLGLAPSLERRFARLDEIQTIWTPSYPAAPPSEGVFSHLATKDQERIHRVDLPQQTMTWAKFSSTVLPTAEQLEVLVPNVGAFIAMTTAVNPDALPILKWDHERERNPVAWYCYHMGSRASQWGLSGGSWAKATAISKLPNNWGSMPSTYLHEGVIVVLEGCRDSMTGQGNALFPEILKNDLLPVRSTIEAYSRGAALGGAELASACGLDLRKGSSINCQLRVLVKGAWDHYRIDRWD